MTESYHDWTEREAREERYERDRLRRDRFMPLCTCGGFQDHHPSCPWNPEYYEGKTDG